MLGTGSAVIHRPASGPVRTGKNLEARAFAAPLTVAPARLAFKLLSPQTARQVTCLHSFLSTGGLPGPAYLIANYRIGLTEPAGCRADPVVSFSAQPANKPGA